MISISIVVVFCRSELSSNVSSCCGSAADERRILIDEPPSSSNSKSVGFSGAINGTWLYPLGNCTTRRLVKKSHSRLADGKVHQKIAHIVSLKKDPSHLQKCSFQFTLFSSNLHCSFIDFLTHSIVQFVDNFCSHHSFKDLPHNPVCMGDRFL